MSNGVEQRLREIEERVSKATPGPWYAHNPDDDYSANVFLVAITPEEPNPWWDGPSESQKVVAITLTQFPRLASVADGRWEENAGFIAHAREDVPWLLSLLREREEENRRLRALLERARIGAWHEACGNHDDPDPTWHCCDWRELAQDIDAALGGDSNDPSPAVDPECRR